MSMLLRVLLVLSSCWLLPLPVAAQTAATVRAQLARPAVLRGEFEQEKQLQGFRNPLKSSGDFLLLRELGIAWNTRKPFASSTRLTRDKLLARLPDGSTQVLIDAKASPGMAAVNALLMALVAGDLDALATRFTLKETRREDGWSLTLQPRDPALKQAFQRIVLEGDRHVHSVDILEPGGDRTRIRFTGLREAPPATHEEAAQLD